MQLSIPSTRARLSRERCRRARLARTFAACAAALASHSAPAAPWALQVRSSTGQPVSDAVVAVELNGEPRGAAPQTIAQMAQRQRQFQPFVLVIQTGTAVSFPNFDTVRHHVYSFSPTKTFDIKLYSGTPARPEVFDKPGVATLGCNIHDRMSAHIVVVDTPLFAKSDAAGWVRMDLPPGQHRLLYWHPRLGSLTLRSQPLRLGPDGATTELLLELAAD